MDAGKISIVVPVYNERENLPLLEERLSRVLGGLADYDHEILFVDDGSRDGSLEILRSMALEDARVRYVSLSRNFGHQSALKAGLERATGDCAIMMDADLQHPPEQIVGMIERWRDGFEIVNMIRRDDRTPPFKRWTAALFYRLINAISDVQIRPGASDFRLLDRKVVDALNGLGERTLFYRGIVPWLGFRQCDIEYLPAPRAQGKSKYDLRRMMLLALDGIISSSTQPLRLATILGLAMSFLSLTYVIYAVAIKVIFSAAIPGWTSLLVGVTLLGGVQLVMLGILGEYLGKVLLEVKGRPSYLVREDSDTIARSPVAALHARIVERQSLP
jgi:polyisoprenyl-phosphate glycosyltransferase